MTAISSKHIASTHAESPKPHLDHPMGIRTILVFLAIMALGLFFAAYNIYRDISTSGTAVTSILPFLLLGVALLIALGERRAKRHGPHHADFDRNGADHLRLEPDAIGGRRAELRRKLTGRVQGRRIQGGGLRRPRRSAPSHHQLFDLASN